MAVKLYEFSTSRSARVRWALTELDIPFEGLTGAEAFQSEEFKKISPLGKIPAILDNERPLVESAAICTWLADSHADKGLSFPSGTWERALHDQWVSFMLTEIEAHLWSTFRNKSRYKEGYQVLEIEPQNTFETKKSLKIVEGHLGSTDYFVDNRFSITDIIAAYTLNWAEKQGVLSNDYPKITAYLDRVCTRPHCTLKRSK